MYRVKGMQLTNLELVKAGDKLLAMLDRCARPDPRDRPNQRSRQGVVSGPDGKWDGGKEWARQDDEIAEAVAAWEVAKSAIKAQP